MPTWLHGDANTIISARDISSIGLAAKILGLD